MKKSFFLFFFPPLLFHIISKNIAWRWLVKSILINFVILFFDIFSLMWNLYKRALTKVKWASLVSPANEADLKVIIKEIQLMKATVCLWNFKKDLSRFKRSMLIVEMEKKTWEYQKSNFWFEKLSNFSFFVAQFARFEKWVIFGLFSLLDWNKKTWKLKKILQKICHELSNWKNWATLHNNCFSAFLPTF